MHVHVSEEGPAVSHAVNAAHLILRPTYGCAESVWICHLSLAAQLIWHCLKIALNLTMLRQTQ